MVDNSSGQEQQSSSNRLLVASGVGVALAVLVVIIWIILRLVLANQAIAQGTGDLPPAANSPLELVSEGAGPLQQGEPPDGGAPPDTLPPQDINLPDDIPGGPGAIPIGVNTSSSGGNSLPLVLSGFALVFSLSALGVSLFILFTKDSEAKT